jgi:hypothetical protein
MIVVAIRPGGAGILDGATRAQTGLAPAVPGDTVDVMNRPPLFRSGAPFGFCRPGHSTRRGKSLPGVVAGILFCWMLGAAVEAGELHMGGATISITPEQPVALAGQMHTRIARHVESPVTATALALEFREGNQVVDQAIMISCDLVAIHRDILERARSRVAERLPRFDAGKMFLNATHTHTAPVTETGQYSIPEGVMSPGDYVDFLVDQLVEVATRAWNNRRPGGVGWGLGHAVVAYNRRSVYEDGRAQMYGPTGRADFRRTEGPEDQGIEVLFFWDGDEKLIATAINVASPAQEVEGRSAIHADFWHEVRELLRAQHGSDLLVLGWTGAAGDQSPRPMFRQAAEQRMRELRNLSRLEEIARRVVHAWEEAYAGARQDIRTGVALTHKVARIGLTPRMILEHEHLEAKARLAALADEPDNHWRIRWHQTVVDRYEHQQAGRVDRYETEVHVLRLGDVAITTNEFELFTDFGIQIKARSPAIHTFVIQLTGSGSYLPTEIAMRGGGYSAVAESSFVGPCGGQELVDQTVELIQWLWAAK